MDAFENYTWQTISQKLGQEFEARVCEGDGPKIIRAFGGEHFGYESNQRPIYVFQGYIPLLRILDHSQEVLLNDGPTPLDKKPLKPSGPGAL